MSQHVVLPTRLRRGLSRRAEWTGGETIASVLMARTVRHVT